MHISPTGIKISFGGRRGPGDEDRPVVARIVGFPADGGSETITREMVVPAGQTIEERLPHGLYNVQLTLPSGRIIQRNVEIEDDTNETYEFFEDFAPGAGFSLQESAGLSDRRLIQESAWVSGNTSQSAFELDSPGGFVASAVNVLKTLSRAAVDQVREIRERPSAATVRLGSGLRVDPNAAVPGGARWREAKADEERGSLGIWRFKATGPEGPHQADRKWARIELADGGVEIASLPLPWFSSANQSYMAAEILVDPARQGGAATRVAIRDSRLSGLLAFLDRGQAASAGPLLRDIEDNLIQETIYQKMSNPLAACAAAYVGLSVYPPNEREQWDEWLKNIMDRFPDVPDAAIVHARRLILRPDNSSGNALAAEALLKAVASGPPFFSAGVALLREMLLLLSADNKAIAKAADKAASLAARVDPTQAFTVLRYAPDPKASS